MRLAEENDQNLELFRRKVQYYCRMVGKTQQALADCLGYRGSSLSQKLSGSGKSILTHVDVKQIVKVLADWQTIYHKEEALELLQLRNLSSRAFTVEEWSSQPLANLETNFDFKLPYSPTKTKLAEGTTQPSRQVITNSQNNLISFDQSNFAGHS